MSDIMHAHAKTIVAAIIFGSACTSLHAQTSSQGAICETRGYTIGFFNGVWNTQVQAQESLDELKSMIGNAYASSPVRFELFYNQSGLEIDGATRAQDLAETFIQRAKEFDSTGELGKRFEYLWEAASGETSFWNKVTNVFSAAGQALEAIYTSFMTKLVAGLSAMLSNPPTKVDYAEHRSKIDTLALEGQKLLLMAHSQGNLFVNPAYDYARSRYATNSVSTLHIAPASMTLRGNHVLADIDHVINALRAFGSHSVPSNNLILPKSNKDRSGHMLLQTYLDASRAGRHHIQQLSLQSLASLESPEAKAQPGFFTTTLTWDGEGDVDIHMLEPGGTHVYYLNMEGSAGTLDVDNRVANGPEHYYASCDSSRLQAGIYDIRVNNFKGPERKATVQVNFANGGQPLTRIIDTGPQRGRLGDPDPLPVARISVQRDDSGNWTATPVQ